jgi:membrane-associated phospholipid phosphatase
MRFLTDFADEAVVLPLIATIAVALAVQGWRRGAWAWLLTIGASFATVLVLKLIFIDCGPAMGVPLLRSPSGHTAAGAVIAGGFAVLVGARKPAVALASVLGAVLIGLTRVLLGEHALPEVLVSGAVGVAGALGFALLAGAPPPLRLRLLFAAVLLVAVLLHGNHLDAEPRIRMFAFRLPFCQAAP